MQNGTSWSDARAGEQQNNRWVDLMVLLGVAVSIGLIAISAIVSFRMAYRSADTELDAWIYGVGAALVDCLKAITPFMVWWGWRGREYLAVIVGIAVFILCSWFSFTNAIGFAADQRSFKEGTRSGAVERHGDDRRDLVRLEKRLGELDKTRSVAEVESAIEAALALPIGKNETVKSTSENCTLNRRETRQTCVSIGELRVELGRAAEKLQVQRDFDAVRARLLAGGGEAQAKVADPQIDVLERLFNLLMPGGTKDNVRLGLVVIVGLVFEVASGLGLYLVTTPWRVGYTLSVGAAGPANKNSSPAELYKPGTAGTDPEEANVAKVVADAVRIGDVALFMSEALEVDQGSILGSGILFAGYNRWCREAGDVPLRGRDFQAAFAELAEEVGIPSVQTGGNLSYSGIRLVGLV